MTLDQIPVLGLLFPVRLSPPPATPEEEAILARRHTIGRSLDDCVSRVDSLLMLLEYDKTADALLLGSALAGDCRTLAGELAAAGMPELAQTLEQWLDSLGTPPWEACPQRADTAHRLLSLLRKIRRGFARHERRHRYTGRDRFRDRVRAQIAVLGLVLLAAGGTTAYRLSLPPLYKFGRPLPFTEAGAGALTPFLAGGWSAVHPDFRWTVGPQSGLTFRIRRPNRDLTLVVDTFPLVTDRFPRQRLEVLANGTPVLRTELSAPQILTVPIPRAIAAASSSLAVTLRMPDAQSPQAMGINADERVLGLAVRSVTLKEE
jgi:hypothetical protein